MYHPKDTVALWQSKGNSQVDNSWYHVHYFQRKSLEKKSSDSYHQLRRSIKPSSDESMVFEQYLNLRLESLLDLGKDVELRVLEGVIEELILPGLGGHHVRETSLTLHHILGVPYLPASSLKGVIRNWAIQAFANGDENELVTGDSLEAYYFQTIFGTQDQKSVVQFYDIFFEEGYEIVQDALTVHFLKYYSDRSPATDNQPTNPVNFYGVMGSGTRILFTVEHQDQLESLEDVVEHWVTQALCEIGIGSKTASGYGRFTHIINVTCEVVGELQAQKNKELEERRQKHEQELKKQQQQALFKTFNAGQRLAYDINHLSLQQQDSDHSKSTLYNQVKDMFGEEQKIAAQALKEYWEKTGDWQRPSKRQREKNLLLQGILGI